MILEVDLITREEILVKLDAVVVGHRGDVVADYLVRLGLNVGA